LETDDALVMAILNQVIINCSIIAAGLPSVHRLLASLNTSQLSAMIPDNEIALAAVTWRLRNPLKSKSKQSPLPTAADSNSKTDLQIRPESQHGSSSATAYGTTYNGSGGQRSDRKSSDAPSYQTDRNTEDDINIAEESSSQQGLHRQISVQKTTQVVVSYE
jgi:hypothetical protein